MDIFRIVVSAALACAPVSAFAAPLVNFDQGTQASDAQAPDLLDIRDHGGHSSGATHGGSHPSAPASPRRGPSQTPERGREERREQGGRRDGERGGSRESRERGFNHQHWRFQRDQRLRGRWPFWAGWGVLWIAGAGLGSCNAYYHYRLDGCYSSCLENANACGADFSGALECSENYAYCANSCQISFSSLYWSVCRIWVPPVPPLIDEPLEGYPPPPYGYPGGEYDSIPEAPTFQ